ncbi:MAG: HNH endonuclease [Thermoanaerobaculia bacterium]
MRAAFDALLYPREHHSRSPDPGPFSNYHRYKRPLQWEFRRKCVYCREADGLKGYEAFGVDHYLARSNTGKTEAAAWENLFYACNVCNGWKGASVSTPELFLPNPCDHVMAEHLQYRDNGGVDTNSRHGAWLADLLRLSSQPRRDRRRFIVSALGLHLIAYNELAETLRLIDKARRATGGSDPDLLREYQQTLEELETVAEAIERLTGEPVPPVYP